MISTSDLYKSEILKNRTYDYRADIAFVDGTVLQLNDKEDLMSAGIVIESATSSSGSFDIGAAITGELKLTLNNTEDKFSQYNFYNAVITIWIGLELSNGTTEYLKKGTYTVDEPVAPGVTISLVALDNMYLLDRPYTDVTTAYPATLGEIVRDICLACSVPLATSKFDNSTYTVHTRPEDDAMTCREMLSYVAQVAGCYVRCNINGAIELKWYSTNVFESEDGLWGGRFDKQNSTEYKTGDNANGGFFDYLDPATYKSGDSASGGTFLGTKDFHHVFVLQSFSPSTDDVVITGTQVTAANDDNNDGETVLCGEEGYVLAIEDNPLIAPGQASIVAEYLGAKIVGMKFRPMSCSCLSDPSMEAGDCAYISDRRGNSYACYLTNIKFTIGGFMQLTCDAESPIANSASEYSAATKAFVKARKEFKKQLSSYDLAMQQLTNLLTQSFGVFKSEETLEDGSTIYYMHNKPTLSASSTIWKMTADAFAVSTDGGKTWNAGIDSSGNAVVNVLSAIGINFDWARGGTLTLGGPGNGNGSTKIYGADGGLIGSWDMGGFYALKGVFKGALEAASGTFAGALQAASGTFTGALEGASGTFTGALQAASGSFIGAVTSSSADITGGRIHIETSSEDISVIYLAYGDTSYTELTSSWFKVASSKGVTQIFGANMTCPVIEGEKIYATDYLQSNGDCKVMGDFEAVGTKARVVDTKDFGNVTLYAYETAAPMFGDMGTAAIDNTGSCHIFLDEKFSAVVTAEQEYYVFLQAEGKGDLWVSEKALDYFVVSGTANLKFVWEVKIRQKNYEMTRLEMPKGEPETELNYVLLGDAYTKNADVDYEESAATYIEKYEREVLTQ